MIDLELVHFTTYRYRRPVALGAHRMMLRPRESRDVRILSHSVTVTPESPVTWAHDVFGNAVATAALAAVTDLLVIEARTRLHLDAKAWPVFDITAAAATYPFTYEDADLIDLGPLLQPQYVDVHGRLRDWARAFVAGPATDTLSLLKDMNAGLSAWVFYQSRDAEGTQGPLETLDRGWGSCRDMAVLFIEAVRTLGFGARIVTGYLYNPDNSQVGSMDQGSTHAWAEVYLPGAGWIMFDPTNRSVGGANLIPVAVARDLRRVMPITGGFVGVPDDLLEMSVAVTVTPTVM